MPTIERCVTCGEDIPAGEAEFDQSGGRIGLPEHKTCASMPQTLKAKIALCFDCGHNEGQHIEVDFDEETYKISNGRYTPCAKCGCRRYLT